MQPPNQQQGETLPQTPGQGATPEAPAPSYVTEAQFQQALDDLRGEVNKNYQGVQKQVDRQKNMIGEQLGQIVERLTKAGIQVSDAQKQQITQSLIMDAFTQPNNPPAPQPGQAAPGAPAQPQGQPDQVEIWANAKAEQMEKEYGLQIQDADPEYAQFVKPVAQADNPVDFLLGVRQALDAKKARLASTPNARMPAAPGMGNAPSQGGFTTNLDELWQRANKK